ncbi:putative uncharacterized protein DDB_G0294196 [Prorops nasuta]|uniref:putative uncharacterized protein DDB_G0294196 n=1 Tax=Prorops nasuta TaxID=863751 RepID=UPI0034CD18DB
MEPCGVVGKASDLCTVGLSEIRNLIYIALRRIPNRFLLDLKVTVTVIIMAEPMPNGNETTKDLLRIIKERVEENGVLLHQIKERLEQQQPQQQQLQPQQQQQLQQQQQQPQQQQLQPQQPQQQQQQQVAVQAFVPATQAARPGYIRKH